jgi:hypothetical protein
MDHVDKTTAQGREVKSSKEYGRCMNKVTSINKLTSLGENMKKIADVIITSMSRRM